MNWIVILMLAGCFIELSIAKDVRRSASSKILSRKKRYITFPEGSSFSCAGCMTVGLIGQPAPQTVAGTFTFGLNWGIAYELPNATETLSYYHSKHRLKKPTAMRRNRRELYEKIETILDNMGYNGRQCILRTLCETTQRVVPHGDNIIEEMFRTLFTFPVSKVIPSEPVEHQIYDSAQRLGKLLDSCDQYMCPLSLVDLVQGYYNAPASNVDTVFNSWALFNNNFG
ncbi:uncharacterized protein LOC113234868 [Hyposmocoma kahamanoa]|uniref:uncharacterized protein LOC113234868 n=1 Tax=Hyposmocoma kahamanoa TaxID=1477025 RepID=UPI000E6D6BF5|nr:uncharacterized protein LOC113234868 [Hyposmocoma kahamanoa]